MQRHLPFFFRLGRRVEGWLQRGLMRSEGQGLVEYGLLLVLIMVVCVGILTITGNTISEVWYDKIINNGAF